MGRLNATEIAVDTDNRVAGQIRPLSEPGVSPVLPWLEGNLDRPPGLASVRA